MSDENKAPALHIPRQHQSAPAETWADKEVRKAAIEIIEGQFTPTIEPDDPLQMMSIGVQRGQLPESPDDIDPNGLLESQMLLQHPRVQEALARLELERDESRNTQEYFEKAQMIYELNTNTAKANYWDGQQRWIGHENEEMRIGLILSVFTFMRKLQAVIGEKRVQLNRFAVANRVAVLAPAEQNTPLILLPGQEINEDGFYVVGTLQYPVSSEWMVMRFDEWGVPTVPKYLGWRTALLSMIRLGILSEREAHTAFPLGDGAAGDWYREQLYMMRAETGALS